MIWKILYAFCFFSEVYSHKKHPITCGFAAIAHKKLQQINSPGWPSDYPNASNCTWNITTTPNYIILLQFLNFTTESCCDHLSIFDDGTEVKRLRGSVVQPYFYSSSNNVMLRFVSDFSETRQGFRITFEKVLASPFRFITTDAPSTTSTTTNKETCGFEAFANATVQQIKSPGWPRNYPNNLDCTWNITTTPGYGIIMRFLNVPNELCCDHLKMFQNGTESRFWLHVRSFVVPFNNVMLRLVSDSSTNRQGFRITFQRTSISINAIMEAFTTTAAQTTATIDSNLEKNSTSSGIEAITAPTTLPISTTDSSSITTPATDEPSTTATKNCDVLDLEIILDSSRSVGKRNFKRAVNFSQELLDELNIGKNETRVSAIQFSRRPSSLFHFRETTDGHGMERKLDRAKYSGRAKNLIRALRYSLTSMLKKGKGFRKSVPSIALIFTDGKWSRDPAKLIKRMRRKDVRVMFVAIGKNPNMTKIKELVQPRDVFTINRLDGVLSAIKNHSANKCVEEPPCPNNQVYSDCASCDRLCDQRNQLIPCTLDCKQKCTCPRSMPYLYKGRCYTANQCPVDPPCPNNQVYSDCAGCDQTCAERGQLIPCFLICQQKCTCPVEMPFLHGGRCYAEPVCPNNQIYSNCTGCDRTCEQLGQNVACTLQCRQKCTCPSMTYLYKGRCYTATQCIKENAKNIDLMFLIDGSASIRDRNFEILKRYIQYFSKYFDIMDGSTRIGVVQYSQYYPNLNISDQPFIRTEVPLGKYRNQSQFDKAVSDIEYMGYTTYTAAGLRKVALDFESSTRFSDSSTNKRLIVITDGRASDSSRISTAAQRLRALGIKIIAVGIGNADQSELRVIATGTQSNAQVFQLSEYSDLLSISDELAIEVYA